ncbi:hypothetical protein [Pseudescherichia sp.]|uniref:hypothetical protein n=1 Tax=Pseudescherichia sp. TaxID=2055881 RepID=UPI0028A6DA34|nr:hypothetical protein [Pseudescherichia sp.]
MLDNYPYQDDAELKRLIILNAALKIAHAAAGASSANTYSSRVEEVLAGVTKNIDQLADAIEESLKKRA